MIKMVRKKVKKAVRRTHSSTVQEKVKHGFDDHMVTAVLVTSGLSLLILLASFMSVTGHAISGTPDTEGMEYVFQSAELLSGDGSMKCTYACAREGKYSIISSVDGELVGNDEVVSGDWTCLCANLE